MKQDLLTSLTSIDIPEFDDLPEDTQKKLVGTAVLSNYVDEIKVIAQASKIDFIKQKNDFIESFSSAMTRKNYSAALERFAAYAEKNNFMPQIVTPEQADGFIKERRAANISNALVRLDTAACSSFFTFLERRYAFVKNPFRGTRERPEKKSCKEISIPAEDEVRTILRESTITTAAAVSTMAYRGLRAGALPNLSVSGSSFKTYSKGKIIKGTFSADVLYYLSMISSPSPFSDLSDGAIEHRIKRLTRRLYFEGKIKDAYSAHDFRHFYAVSEYEKDKDIYRVSKLLGHSSIAVTERYLRSIDVLE